MAETTTQLEWSPTLGNGERMTYAKAEKAIKALGPEWRFPTVQELLSLVDYSRCDPAIDIERFPDTKSGAYWTSTPCAWAPRAAWFVYFGHGGSDSYHRDFNSAFVRACRALPAGQ